MRRVLAGLVAGVAVLAAGGFALTAPPAPDPALVLPQGDAAAGALVFAAAGCAACHSAPGSDAAEPPVLAGGTAFATAFGTFYAPNISTHPDAGIGGWTGAEVLHAIRAGVSPGRSYYYPVFPSHAYALMTDGDAADLLAYLRTLPADATPSRPHDVSFPFSIRRSLAVWRWLNGPPRWTGPDGPGPEVLRGRYLAEALGHCAECHTPRGALGHLDRDRWMAGAPAPSGDGRVPNLTPAALAWSQEEVTRYLESGFTPEFDVAGGEMVAVIANLAKLPEADRAALAAYLAALPPVKSD